MKVEKTDIELITEILAGNKQAFDILYKRYVRNFMLTCLRYVKKRELAEDMLQESFISIYKDLHQFNAEKGNFKSWSKRVVINTCLMHLRKNNALNNFQNILELAQPIRVNEVAVQNLNLEDLTKLIWKLPKGYRTVFNMYIIDGYSHQEIADQLNISVSTSKTQLMRARKLLKNYINPDKVNTSSNYAVR